jgi:hypothetical protein
MLKDKINIKKQQLILFKKTSELELTNQTLDAMYAHYLIQ